MRATPGRFLPTPSTPVPSPPASFPQPPRLRQNTNVPTSSDDLHRHAAEELLHPCHVPRGHDQNNLGRFWEVAPWGPPRLQVLEVFQDVPEPPPPPYPASSEYYGWVTWGRVSWSSLMRGRNPITYAILIHRPKKFLTLPVNSSPKSRRVLNDKLLIHTYCPVGTKLTPFIIDSNNRYTVLILDYPPKRPPIPTKMDNKNGLKRAPYWPIHG